MVGVVGGGGLLGGRTAQRPAGEGGRGNGKDEHDGPHPDEAPVRVQGALAVLARVHTGDEEKEERHEKEGASRENRYDAHHHGGHQQALVPAPCSTNS